MDINQKVKTEILELDEETLHDLPVAESQAEETKAGKSTGFTGHGSDLLTENVTINF